jgi:phosphoribosylglycinamide formyltransferase-1
MSALAIASGAGRPARLGVLASGSGSNLQALLDACASGALQAQVAVVICNVAGAKCLDRARDAGVPAVLLPHQGLKREAYDTKLVAALREHGATLVCLAGFMRIITGVLLRAFPDRVLNIHPALLPSFPGMHGARQALAAGVRVAGCTVHFVDEGTDTGPILVQAAVPVLPDDTEESLQARIHAQEHKAYVRAVRLVLQGAVELVDEGGKRRARLSGLEGGGGAEAIVSPGEPFAAAPAAIPEPPDGAHDPQRGAAKW